MVGVAALVVVGVLGRGVVVTAGAAATGVYLTGAFVGAGRLAVVTR